jgi:hypothetical protein
VCPFAILALLLSTDACFIKEDRLRSRNLGRASFVTHSGSPRYRAGRREQAVERKLRTMFAERPSRVALHRLSTAKFPVQRPIFGDYFKAPLARNTWPRF